MISCIPLGYIAARHFQMDPFKGALLGLVAAETLKYAVSAFAVHRRGLPVLRIDILCSPFIAIAVVIFPGSRPVSAVAGSEGCHELCIGVAGCVSAVASDWILADRAQAGSACA